MQRRSFILTSVAAAASAATATPSWAHHGWSGFDQTKPIYLEGKAASVRWANPHAELQLDLADNLRLPADLAQRAVPTQSTAVDGPALLKAAQLPTRKDKRWEIELAPISRMDAWKVPPIKAGDAVAVLGFTSPDEKGAAVVRAEYLFYQGKVYGLRSSPA